MEMYTQVLSAAFVGMTFPQAAEYVQYQMNFSFFSVVFILITATIAFLTRKK